MTWLSPTIICVFVGATLITFALPGCGGAKYSAVVKAARSELSPKAQAQDDLHKLHLREALAGGQGFSGLTLSVYVFMERGYVVGRVDSAEQAEAVLRTARHVAGLRSVEGYLPVRKPSPNDSDVSNTASELGIKAEIESALALAAGVVKSRVNVEVLDGQVVLLGVVSGNEERFSAEQAARGTNAVKEITNWLLLPESEYMSIRSKLL
jgi:hyperosmotically inducible periplasmic protein